MRRAPACTGAGACSAPTPPSMGAPRPPSPAPSASATRRASCAAAPQASRVSSLPPPGAEGPPLSTCTRRGAGLGSRASLWASVSLAIKWAPPGPVWLCGHRREPQLGLFQGTTAAWTWTSAPQGRASGGAAARTCPMAFSVTVQKATQVGSGAGQGQSRWVWGEMVPLADAWRLD